MMRLAHYSIVILLPFLFLVACEKDSQTQENNQSENNTRGMPCQKLPHGLLDLSADDARLVATLFVEGDLPTKTKMGDVIKSIVPVYGEGEDILMYAVNFEDGYILISATTSYYPILAIVEHGSYSILPDSGQEYIMNEMKIAIAQSKDYPIQDVSKAWEAYMSAPHVDTASTKVSSNYYSLFEQYMMDWVDDGRNVYPLKFKPDEMPDDLYDSFCEEASIEMPGDYPYMDYAVITEKYCTSRTNHGPFLVTRWDQEDNGDGTGIDFNSDVPNNMVLGCVTVAVGQIMHYFKYPPQAYNWNAMSYTTSNTVLSSFLAQLRTELHVDNDGGSNYQWAKRVLQNYGYSVSVANHSSSSVYSSLSHNRPVYMRGWDSACKEGHAWVCDGFSSSLNYYEYKLYLLRVINGRPYDFIDWLSDRVYYYFGPSFFHMNWGWGGLHNGYYLDSNVTPYGTSDNYSAERKDLFISAPGYN